MSSNPLIEYEPQEEHPRGRIFHFSSWSEPCHFLSTSYRRIGKQFHHSHDRNKRGGVRGVNLPETEFGSSTERALEESSLTCSISDRSMGQTLRPLTE